jgi:amino acid transporter
METEQSIFSILVQKIKNIPRTKETLYSYITLLLTLFLVGWLILAGFLILFGVNIFWKIDTIIIYTSLAIITLLCGLYSTYLNTKRLKNEELINSQKLNDENN